VRADAVANRRRVLAAAQEVFAEQGVEASTETVARRAGVGVGTVFRHFPTKRDLVEHTLAAHLDELAEGARVAGTGDDAVAALTGLVAEMAEHAPTKLAMAGHLLAEGGQAGQPGDDVVPALLVTTTDDDEGSFGSEGGGEEQQQRKTHAHAHLPNLRLSRARRSGT